MTKFKVGDIVRIKVRKIKKFDPVVRKHVIFKETK